MAEETRQQRWRRRNLDSHRANHREYMRRWREGRRDGSIPANVPTVWERAAAMSNGQITAKQLERMEPVRYAPRTAGRIAEGEFPGVEAARGAALKELGITDAQWEFGIMPEGVEDPREYMRQAVSAFQDAPAGGDRHRARGPDWLHTGAGESLG